MPAPAHKLKADIAAAIAAAKASGMDDVHIGKVVMEAAWPYADTAARTAAREEHFVEASLAHLAPGEIDED